MYLFYVDNKDYKEMASSVDDLSGDGHKVQLRNPKHFSGPKELHGADKVFLCGKYEAVEEACKEIGKELVHLTYDSKQVPATPDSKTPSEEWSKDQLIEVARANGINATTRWKKSTIVEKLNETRNA